MISNDSTHPTPTFLYHLCPVDLWYPERTGGYRQEGPFTHLSTAAQVEPSARLHLNMLRGVLLICIRRVEVERDLCWDPSRGGALFPHLYGPITPEMIYWIHPLPDADHLEDGERRCPPEDKLHRGERA